MTNRRYKTAEFAQTLIDILTSLRVPTWTVASSLDSLSPEQLKIYKVSGSLTNAVFFVSYPSRNAIKTVLLRIYGPSSSSLINRVRELRVLYVLSSQYGIGPRVYGTFENGRVEEYFESSALTVAQIRDPQISSWIGTRMAELHCVDVEAVEGENELRLEIAAIRNVRLWLEPAREVKRLYSSSFSSDMRAVLDLDRFVGDWNRYMAWLKKWEQTHGASKRVFAHNDTQCGNLLMLKRMKPGLPDHRQVICCNYGTIPFSKGANNVCQSPQTLQCSTAPIQIIVVDFEYAALNPAAFDIANHFQEWTTNYQSQHAHLLDHSRYPDDQERRHFYEAYLKHSHPPYTTTAADVSVGIAAPVSPHEHPESFLDLDKETRRLEAQVQAWNPASHGMWAIWSIVQARDDLEQAAAAGNDTMQEEPEFDYLGYAVSRMEGFRRELVALGL